MEKFPENFQPNPPYFSAYVMPHGWLTPQIECHALFYYYLLARKNYENHLLNWEIVLEDQPDPEVCNFKQLFISIARLYQVEPERMKNYWKNVDLQCHFLNLPRVPKVGWIRFDDKPVIKTES